MLLLKACALVFLAIALVSLAASADMQTEVPPPVPEPTSWMFVGIGALGGAWAVRRRRRG
jgi:hypothetical protein